MEMKNFLIILVCLLSASPAFAAAAKPIANNDLGITDKDCQQIVDYQTPPGVDYQPGVDVHGKPVVEADLAPSVVKLPEKYSFDLNIDAAHYLGLTVPAGSQGLMKVGTITIDKNGQATFNGKPMEGDAMAALKAACAAKKPQNPPNETAPPPK